MTNVLDLIWTDVYYGSTENTTTCPIPVANGVIDFKHLPDGPYEERDKNGNLILEGTIKNRHLDGKLVRHLPDNGNITVTMKDGVLDGPWSLKWRYRSDWKEYAREANGHFEDGKLTGKYKCSAISSRSISADVNGFGKTGREEVYFIGRIESDFGYYSIDENGFLDGECEFRRRAPSGEFVLASKRIYDKGQIVKETRFDTETGDILSENNYKRDEKYQPFQVVSRGLNAYGMSKLFGHYGIPHGACKSFYEGKCTFDGHFKDGILDGKCMTKPFRNSPEEYHSTYRDGKQIEFSIGTHQGTTSQIRRYPGETDFSWRYWDDSHNGYLQPETICSCTNLKKLYLDNSSEDRSGNWCVSNRKIPQEVWDGIAQNTDLEDVKLMFMDVDYKALSKLKKLKHLEIGNSTTYGDSGFVVRDGDIRALGILPELESLSIDCSQISAYGLAKIKEQFPTLKKLQLRTNNPVVAKKKKIEIGKDGWLEEDQKISHAELIEYCKDFDFDINGITSESLVKEIEEIKRRQALIGPGFEDKFKAAVKKGDSKAAIEILYLNGLIERIDKNYKNSDWKAPIMDVYHEGMSDYRFDNDTFVMGRIIDLKNGNYAIAVRRNEEHGSSGHDCPNVSNHFYNRLMVLNLKDGVLESSSPSYSDTFDVSVEGDKVSLGDIALLINPPARKDLCARLRTATKPEDRKTIAEVLSKGTNSRNRMARVLKTVRKTRDKGESPVTARAYQARKESTK